jgi:hypothetical protein
MDNLPFPDPILIFLRSKLWFPAFPDINMDDIITYDVIPEFQGVFLPPLSGKLLFQRAPW